MSLQDELCFVQFIHPGKEHGPDSTGIKGWNTRPHRRKFLEIGGRYRRKGKNYRGPIRFWGEWEPQSEVESIKSPVSNGPCWVHRPYYVVPRSYRGLQNSDPFVFDGFYYGLCQQNTIRGPTQLRYLRKGSVILFGSCVGGQFALDTVFVVDNCVEFHLKSPVNELREHVRKPYVEANVKTWRESHENEVGCGATCDPTEPQSFRLYFGATAKKPVNDMFSYFPCQPAHECANGFARPIISFPGIVTDNLLQGKRLNRGVSAVQIKKRWKYVQRQVESAGLCVGVYAEMPECRLK